MERYLEKKEHMKMNIHVFRWNHERGATGSFCKRFHGIGFRVERAAMAVMAGERKRLGKRCKRWQCMTHYIKSARLGAS
jgi:hypothetical protein